MINSLITNAITFLFGEIANSAVGVLGVAVAWINTLPATYLDSPPVTTGIRIAQAVAGGLLAVKLAHEALRVYILHVSGDPAADPGGLLRRSALAAAGIAGAPEAVRQLYAFGSALAADIAQNVLVFDAQQIESMLSSGVAVGGSMVQGVFSVLFLPVLLVVGIVLLLVVVAQCAIRAVEVGFFSVAGPIMAVGLTSDTEGVWGVWWRKLVALSMQQAVQTFLVMSAGAAMISGQPVLNLIMFTAVMFVAVKAPAALQEFAVHTGLGGAAGHVGQSVGMWWLLRRGVK